MPSGAGRTVVWPCGRPTTIDGPTEPSTLVVAVLAPACVDLLVVVGASGGEPVVAAAQFLLQRVEVRVRGAVLELSGHLRLLGLGSSASHVWTPSHRAGAAGAS